MSAQSKQTRGQALVEAAFGVVALLTVFVYAVRYTEVGFAALKVQEASAAALWSSTGGGRKHAWPDVSPAFDKTPLRAAAAQSEVQARYQDFDGRTSSIGSGTFSQFYTQASNLSVRCAMGTPPSYGPGIRHGPYAFDLMIGSAGSYYDNGGLNCNADADIDLTSYVPMDLFDDRYMGLGLRQTAKPTMKVCAFGRAWGGTCHSTLNMQLDEWAGENDYESGLCLLLPNPAVATGCSAPTPNRNTAFHESAKRMFDKASTMSGSVTPEGSLFATAVVGWSPISVLYPGQHEGNFWMSVSGEEALFTQPALPAIPIGFTHYRVQGYGTTPGAATPISWEIPYFTSYVGRALNGCFLGRPCN